ncbi:MAG: glycosyltransferase family 4 protein, partial [Candidatus Kapabacteria bacterium]|nr:glycosyltransferase family 4 protein [Candidatus Kapabacteria bacterium]MDW7997741.1 glycosyltransferase family 4 protein [Bacteroidota bacterium]
QGLRGWLHPRWIRQAERILKGFGPDVIYQRGKLPETILAARYARRYGTLFVWCSNADNSALRWKFVRKRLRYRRRPLWLLPARVAEAAAADYMIERALRFAGLVIAQTRHQQRTLAPILGKEPTLVGSGHPLPPPPTWDPETTPVVLWLANLTPVKQPLAFVRLARYLQHVPARFLMAGAAPNPQLLADVRREAEGLHNFAYAGPVPFAANHQLFARSHLLVLTSLFEGLPNTLVQACLYGVPTISLRNDPDGLIKTYGIGEVVPDEASLVRAVEQWVEDPERRRAAGERAYALARTQFDIRVVVDKLSALVLRHLRGS